MGQRNDRFLPTLLTYFCLDVTTNNTIATVDEEPVLMKEHLSPGESAAFAASLSQVWFARDKRVDDFKHGQERINSFSDESVLMVFHVLEEFQTFTIPPHRTCYDLATDCDTWAQYGECRRQPQQMEKLCPNTCAFCEQEEIIYHLIQGQQQQQQQQHEEL